MAVLETVVLLLQTVQSAGGCWSPCARPLLSSLCSSTSSAVTWVEHHLLLFTGSLSALHLIVLSLVILTQSLFQFVLENTLVSLRKPDL